MKINVTVEEIPDDSTMSTTYSFDDLTRARTCIQWLCNAHNAGKGLGVSDGFSVFRGGWGQSNIRSTSSVIETFLKYGKFDVYDSLIVRSESLGDSLLYWYGGPLRIQRDIDKARAIIALSSLYETLERKDFLNAIVTYGKDIEQNIVSRKNSFEVSALLVHSLLELYKLTGDKQHKKQGKFLLETILIGCRKNCLLPSLTRNSNGAVNTQVLTGFLLSLFKVSSILEKAERDDITQLIVDSSERLLKLYESRKRAPYLLPRPFPRLLNNEWRSISDVSDCIACAQLAIIWAELFVLQDDYRFLNASLKIIDQLKKSQFLRLKLKCLYGGMPEVYQTGISCYRLNLSTIATNYFLEALMSTIYALNGIRSSK